MGWLKDKLWELDDIFTAFPKVKWLLIFYMFLSIVSAFMYMPALEAIANFKFNTAQPFYSLIVENFHILKWGQLVIPLGLILWGILDVMDLYQRKLEKHWRY